MTYQQAIADAIKLFLTMDVATTAVTGFGLFSFCHVAVDAVTIVASSIMAADAVTTITTTAATAGSGSSSTSSVADVVTTTVADAANPSMIYPMGSSILNPLVLPDIYPMSTS